LTNAIKFTASGGRIDLVCEQDDEGCLTITVTDSGIGIDEAGMETALSEFGRVETGQSPRTEGTGLGLPLSKGLMELHGGELELVSRPGEGTTVTLIFPKESLIP
jgi:signal transduction histidine kinase